VDKKKYLEDELPQRIASFSGSAKWFRRRHYLTSVGVLILTLAITIVSGFNNLLSEPAVINIVLVLGALSSFVTAWGAFFAPRESWALYAQTASDLRATYAQFAYSSASMNDEGLDAIFSKYQEILAKHNESWSKLRKQDT
jgi:hypothetical protein